MHMPCDLYSSTYSNAALQPQGDDKPAEAATQLVRSSLCNLQPCTRSNAALQAPAYSTLQKQQPSLCEGKLCPAGAILLAYFSQGQGLLVLASSKHFTGLVVQGDGLKHPRLHTQAKAHASLHVRVELWDVHNLDVQTRPCRGPARGTQAGGAMQGSLYIDLWSVKIALA